MRSFQIAAILAAATSVQAFEFGKTIESIHKSFDSIVERAAPQFGGSPSASASAPAPAGSAPADSAPASGAPKTSGAACPAIWSTISKDLVGQFLTDGQCNDLARAAIRIAFHDCATWNTSLGTSAGCDGSLYLAGEYTRPENAGLEDTIPQLGKMAQSYGVGVADFFQFAGGMSSISFLVITLTYIPIAAAIKICPLGPTVQTFVGRTDRSTPNPEGLLPGATEDGNSILALFEAKGINAAELAALIGAHSTARQFATDPAEAGAALDTTPGVWDVAYYGQTVDGTAPFTLQSDKNLANQAEVGPVFHSFINNQIGWAAAFAPAMTKMSLFGVETSGLIDCTSVIPAGTLPKRSVARGAMF